MGYPACSLVVAVETLGDELWHVQQRDQKGPRMRRHGHANAVRADGQKINNNKHKDLQSTTVPVTESTSRAA